MLPTAFAASLVRTAFLRLLLAARRAALPALLFLSCALGAACDPVGGPTEILPPGGPNQQPPPPKKSPPNVPVSCPGTVTLPPSLPVGTTAPAGTIPGAFQVSATGSAVYAMPLVVPPGRAGIEPSLTVTYDSASGNGQLGMGFSLGGFSAIARCASNTDQDHRIRGVRFDDEDQLCLDGKRLVQVGTTQGTDPNEPASGIEYRTFPDTFTKVVGTLGPLSKVIPDHFEARTKDGRILTYGAEPTSRALATGGLVRAWWISAMADRAGNTMSFTYKNDTVGGGLAEYTAEIAPAHITYTDHPDAAASASVNLTYAAKPAADRRTTYAGGMALRSAEVLQKVVTRSHGQEVREYRFAYDSGKNTGRTRLTSVTECAADGACKPPTLFTWAQGGKPPGFELRPTSILQPGTRTSSVMMMDFDGDGRDDLVVPEVELQGAVAKTDWNVALDQGPGKGYFPATERAQTEILVPPPDYVPPYAPELGTPVDYDQDGRMDVLLHDVDNHFLNWQVLLSRPGDDPRCAQAGPHGGCFIQIDTGIPRTDFGLPAKPNLIPQGLVDANGAAHLADVNGDGVPDLIQCNNTGNRGALPGSGGGVYQWTVHLHDGAGFSPTALAIGPLGPVYACDTPLYTVDVDGDGKVDLFIPDVPAPQNPTTYVALTLEQANGMTADFRTLGVSLPFAPGLLFMDLNADGLPDVVETGFADGQLRTSLNEGVALGQVLFSAPALAQPSVPWLFPQTDTFAYLASPIDFNGDGLQDLLIPSAPDQEWMILVSTGDGNFNAVHSGIVFGEPYLPDPSGYVGADYVVQGPRITDADGNGTQDILMLQGGSFVVYESRLGDEDLLASVTDGLRAFEPADPAFLPSVLIAYGHLVDAMPGASNNSASTDHAAYVAHLSPQNDCTYPRQCVAGSMRVTSGYELNRGDGILRSFEVQYRDGRYDRRGRGFLGFGSRVVRDLNTLSAAISIYDNVTRDDTLAAYPNAGQAVSEWRVTPAFPTDADPTRVDYAFTDEELTTVRTNQDRTYFTYPSRLRETREQGQAPRQGEGQELSTYLVAVAGTGNTLSFSGIDASKVDLYGNVQAEVSTSAGVDLTTQVTRTFDNDPATWLIGKLRQEKACSTVMQPSPLTACHVTSIKYDGNGFVRHVTQGAASPSTRLDVTFSRDPFGNVTGTVAVDGDGEMRSSCATYDAEGLFPVGHENALGQITVTRFDQGLGSPLATMDPDQRLTQWARDGFGRTTREVRADGTSTTRSLQKRPDGRQGHSGTTVQIRTTTAGVADDTVELDSLGRPVWWTTHAVGVGGDSGKLIVWGVDFDDLGERVARRSVPTWSTTPAADVLHDVTFYDALGRVKVHTTPWLASTVVAYDGTTLTVTDPAGGVTVTHKDALGRPVQIVDPTGEATFSTYGPFGLLRTAGPIGASTDLERDDYGRATTTTDPDRGKTDATYNGFGDLVTTKDALGRQTALFYDALGRPLSRNDADGTTTWTWDTAPHGIGQLAAVTSPASVAVNYGYDVHGRPHTTETVLDGESFVSTLDYDGVTGLPSKLTYPASQGSGPLAVAYGYDGYGHLTSVADDATGKPFWTWDLADDAGRVLEETFGSGAATAVTDRTYYPDMDRVKSITTRAGAKVMQRLTYDYDVKRNLRHRTDGLQQETEELAYDPLDRLTCHHLLGDGHDCGASPTYEYDAAGNLTKKEGAPYTYEPAHPHAVKTAGAEAFGSDAVGNQIKRPAGAVKYTAFDLPSQVPLADKSGAAILAYDGNQQRVRKTTPATVTVSIGGLYERVTDKATGIAEHRYTVRSAERTVAVVTRRSNEPLGAGLRSHRLYLHVDNLGSVDILSDDSGTVTERRSYDPFGARRDPDWKKPGSPTGAKVTEGFTGQDDDADLGLVDMKGRLYDPKLGRFLTPDPVVQSPGFSQSYNRYSYVFNNPLTFVDPSGFEGEPAGGVDVTTAIAGIGRAISRAAEALFGGSGHHPSGPRAGADPRDGGPAAGSQAGATQAPTDLRTTGNSAGTPKADPTPPPPTTPRQTEVTPETLLHDVLVGYTKASLSMWKQSAASAISGLPSLLLGPGGRDLLQGAQAGLVVGATMTTAAAQTYHAGGDPARAVLGGLQAGIRAIDPTRPGRVAVDDAIHAAQRGDVQGATGALTEAAGHFGGIYATVVAVALTGGGAAPEALAEGVEGAAGGLATGRAYSVAFEAAIPEAGVGSRALHFKAANGALSEALAADPHLASAVEGLGIRVPRSAAGTILGESPKGWSWHHVPDQPGMLQLVPRGMHQGGPWQPLLHPGGVGGFSLWGTRF